MPLILLHTEIAAPVERCFNLSRSMEMHVLSMKESDERIVGGRTSGLIEVGETVIFRARHFWITQQHVGKISEMDFPNSFVDTMISGTFKSLHHLHIFIKKENCTVMKDEFFYESPLGVLGKLADYLFLKKYLEKILKERNSLIKSYAESNQWKTILV
ncbi:MAG: SRPBCC family protein [Bacteroidetes bacterium]|nr:SRPBCC family protein [Bacteroidota bacterium]